MRRHVPFFAEAQPMSAMNTTPLIDVLLVLLIMMIMTIPLQTHEVPIALPGEGRPEGVPPPIHRLAIGEGGALSWDGSAIADAELPARLAAFQADPARPVLQLQPDGEARYDRFAETLSTVRKSGVTALGFVGNERFR